MKQITLILLAALFFVGCIKNDPVTNASNLVEFDAATWNANSLGKTYPIMTSVPRFGAAGGTPAISRTAMNNFNLRVNLLGAQRSTPTTFQYQVVTSESTAQSGVHFAPLSGTGTIPADSSFGLVNIQVLNPGPSANTSVDLILELLSTGDVPANTNYAKVGLRIAQ